MSKIINLSRGLETVVDDIDYEYLLKFFPKWQATPAGSLWRVQVRKMINGKVHTYSMHRIIMQCIAGPISKEYEVDHINRDSLDNRRDNLRICTRFGSTQNRGKNKNGKTSKYKGVSWNVKDSKWRVQICINRKNTYVGSFLSEDEAAIAYNKSAIIHYGEFAVLNVIE